MFGKPEIVDWSPTLPGHSGDDQIKQLFHLGISLITSCPYFNPDETWISFGVRNNGRKALGIGPGGIVLVPALPAQIMQCKSIKTGGLFGNAHSSLTVDTGRWEDDIIASFDSAPKPSRVIVLIQMKRILSAPLEFRIPFDLGVTDK